MALQLSEEVATKVSTQAAERFIGDFYKALNNEKAQRSSLATFYIQPTELSPLTADISLNGNQIATPGDLQTTFITQMPDAYYEPQSHDCHVLNPNYNIGLPEANIGPDPTGKKMSILLVVSGYVKFGEKRSAPQRGFTDTFILVPNYNMSHSKENWLIQSQNFRMVV